MSRRKNGALEAEVLARLSQSEGPSTTADLVEQFDGSLAYTTLNTILGRLVAKGMATRIRTGRNYSYELAIAEADLVGQQLYDRLHQSSDQSGVLQRFVSVLSEAEAEELRDILDRLGH